MIEAILNVVLFGIITLSALLAGFFLVIAAVRHSKTMLRIGLAIIVVPIFICGSIYWYYNFHIASLKKGFESKYIGLYLIELKDQNVPEDQQKVKLKLNEDNTFYLDKNSFSRFAGSGKWRSGATDDGKFEFQSDKNAAKFWASPINDSQLVIDLDLDLTSGRTVTFVKQ